MTKVLLVEDDKSLREIYGVRLLAEGYDIISAGDGEEALAMAIKERPGLIVSDVMMPKISGFDMLDILRSTTETKEIKVIMMTALSSEDQRQRGEQLGADRYLVKSQVGIEDVVRTVHEVLGDLPGSAPAQPTASSSLPPSQPQAPVAAVAPSAPSRDILPQPQQVVPSERPASPTVPDRPVIQTTEQPQPTPPAPAPAAAPVSQVSAQSYSPSPQQVSEPTSPPSAQPQAQEEYGLPQPTAPFSTQRPAGLADRIIQPLEKANPLAEQEVAKQMERELNTGQDALGTALSDVQPQQPEAVQYVESAPSTAPNQPEEQSQPPELPSPNQHGIEFEETPLESPPPQAQSSQPPSTNNEQQQ